MSLFKKKKDKDEADMSVVDDYKEPFTWRNFWDEQIVSRIKKIHDFLAERGILAFFMSPFQYKNRLIVKIALIAFGVLAGIIPRANSLLNETRQRNAESEMAQATTQAAGPITVTPLESSNYHRQHVMVLNIAGATSDGVPSVAGGFDVKLSVNRGVNDAKHVKYKYSIIPVDDSNRLMVLYVDNRKQDDNTGIFNLSVNVKAQDKMESPIEVILSTTQKTTDLFRGGDVNLAPISKQLINLDGTESESTIVSAQKDLKKALSIYNINQERLEALNMTPIPDYDKLKKWVNDNSILTNLNDNSTVDAITAQDDKEASKSQPSDDEESITPSIKYGKKVYVGDSDGNSTGGDDDDDTGDSDNDDKGDNEVMTKADQINQTELPDLANYIQNVQTALQTLNQSRMDTYSNLKMLQKILKQEINPKNMGPTYHVH